jgi:hypothetical protein
MRCRARSSPAAGDAAIVSSIESVRVMKEAGACTASSSVLTWPSDPRNSKLPAERSRSTIIPSATLAMWCW